jgi:hypothetical protein
MKIIVVSDTHIPKRAKKLPERLMEDLEDADLIIQCLKKSFMRNISFLKIKETSISRGASPTDG